MKVSGALHRLAASQRGLADRLPRADVSKMVDLSVGDPSFSTPDYIIRAATRAMEHGYTHYPAPQGDPELRDVIADYQSRVSGATVSAPEVLITAGGTTAITVAMLALLDPGDEVIILDPSYSLYTDGARVVGSIPILVPLTNSFRVDIDAVKQAITPRARMLILNYPSNPTGQLLLKEELDGLAKIAVENDLVVLSDEVYDQLIFNGRHVSVLSHSALTDRTVLVNSFSKTYAMTGWRLGWIVAKKGLIEPIFRLNRSTADRPSSISQRAGIEALSNKEEDRKWRSWMLGQYSAQREAMWQGLRSIPGVHAFSLDAAFYAWVRYEADLNAIEMMKYLYERGLCVRPGTEFGSMGEKHLRFTFARSAEEINDGIAIFKTAMEELRAGKISAGPLHS